MGTCCSRPHRPEDGRRSSEFHGCLGRALLTRRQLARVGVDNSNLGLERHLREEYQRAAVQSDPMVSDKETRSCKSTVNDSKEEQNKESVNGINTPCQQTLTEPVREEEDIVHTPLCFTVSSLIAMFEDSEDDSDDSIHHKETVIEATDHQIQPLEHPDTETSQVEYENPLCDTVSSLIAVFEDASDDDDILKVKSHTDGQSTNREHNKPETTASETHDTAKLHETDKTECSQRQEDHLPNIMAPKLESLSNKQGTFSHQLHKVHKEMEHLLNGSITIDDDEDEIGGGLTPVCIDAISRKVQSKFTEFSMAPLQNTVKDLRDDCIAQPNNREEIPQNTDDTVSRTDTEHVKGFASGMPDISTKPKDFIYAIDKKIRDYRKKSVVATTAIQLPQHVTENKTTSEDKPAITRQKTSADRKHTTEDNKTIYDKYIRSARFDKNDVEQAKNLITVFEQDASIGIIVKLQIKKTTHKTSQNAQKDASSGTIDKLPIKATTHKTSQNAQKDASSGTIDKLPIKATTHKKSQNAQKDASSGIIDKLPIKATTHKTLQNAQKDASSGIIDKLPIKATTHKTLQNAQKDASSGTIDTLPIKATTHKTLQNAQKDASSGTIDTLPIKATTHKTLQNAQKDASSGTIDTLPIKATTHKTLQNAQKDVSSGTIDTLPIKATTHKTSQNAQKDASSGTIDTLPIKATTHKTSQNAQKDVSSGIIDKLLIKETTHKTSQNAQKDVSSGIIDKLLIKETTHKTLQNAQKDASSGIIDKLPIEATTHETLQNGQKDASSGIIDKLPIKTTTHKTLQNAQKDASSGTIDKLPIKATTHKTSQNAQKDASSGIIDTLPIKATTHKTLQNAQKDASSGTIDTLPIKETTHKTLQNAQKDVSSGTIDTLPIKATTHKTLQNAQKDASSGIIDKLPIKATTHKTLQNAQKDVSSGIIDKLLIKETTHKTLQNAQKDASSGIIDKLPIKATTHKTSQNAQMDASSGIIDALPIKATKIKTSKDAHKDASSGIIDKIPLKATTHKTLQDVQKLDKGKYSISQGQTENDYVGQPTCSKTNYNSLNKDVENNKTSKLKPRITEDVSHSLKDNSDKAMFAATRMGSVVDSNNRDDIDKVKDKNSAIYKTEVETLKYVTLAKPTCKMVRPEPVRDAMVSSNMVTTSLHVRKQENNTAVLAEIGMKTVRDANNKDKVKNQISVGTDKTEVETLQDAALAKPICKMVRPGPVKEAMVSSNMVTSPLLTSATEKDTAMFDATRIKTVHDANNRDKVKDTNSVDIDKTEVETLKDVTHSNSRPDMATRGLANARRAVLASGRSHGTSALAKITTNLFESKVNLTVAKSLEKINTHSEKGHCEISHYVRSPSGLAPRMITLSASPKMIRDGFAKRKILESKSILKQNKPAGPLSLERKRSKMHIGKRSDLVISGGKDDPKMVQKEAPSGSAMLSGVPQFHEPHAVKLNARQRMGIEKLQNYKITIQCRAIERIKVDENEFPGILPEKLQRKWRSKVNDAKAKMIN